MTARILNVTEAEYHADKSATVPTLSVSIAHTLLSRSPLHAWTEHPRFGNVRPTPTDEMDDGTVIHMLLLGAGPQLDVIKAENYRTKAAQELRDAARTAGRIPIIERKYDEIVRTAAKLRENLADMGVVLDGQSEVAIEWTEANGVLCRCKLDHLKGPIIYDLKKITSADPQTCSRHALTYGYDIQSAAYSAAVEALQPELTGRLKFVFGFMELEPPHCFVPREASSSLLALGVSKWHRACELWKRCLAGNYWPGYVPSELEPPPWAIVEEEGTLS